MKRGIDHHRKEIEIDIRGIKWTEEIEGIRETEEIEETEGTEEIEEIELGIEEIIIEIDIREGLERKILIEEIETNTEGELHQERSKAKETQFPENKWLHQK